jgi:hypothetical protein
MFNKKYRGKYKKEKYSNKKNFLKLIYNFL